MLGSLLAVLATWSSLVQSAELQYRTENLKLAPGEMTIIESLNYPHTAPGNLRQSWMLKTDPGAVITLSCNDIRLFQGRPCGDYSLTVSEPGNSEEVCGARFNYVRVSKESRLGVSLRTGPMGQGFVRCRAAAIPRGEAPVWAESPEESKFANLTFSSEEIEDSSEYGGPKGRKGTTCDCGWANKNSGRIFGGKEAHINEFPFMAGVLRHGMKTIFCGSTIVTPQHALSAAHCFYGKEAYGPFDVVVGEHDVQRIVESDVTEYILIKKTVLHKGYNPSTHMNDIALLVLDKELTFSKKIGPVCIPKAPLDLEGEFIKIIGWGRTPEKKLGSPVLQKVDMKVLPKPFCAKIRPGLVPKGSPTQLCTYGQGKSACSGDSGGPLLWVDPQTNRYNLVGIVSYGTKECGNKIPRVSTDVSAYLDWIQNKIKENGQGMKTCSKA